MWARADSIRVVARYARPLEEDYVVRNERGTLSVSQLGRTVGWQRTVGDWDKDERAMQKLYRVIAERMHKEQFFPNVWIELERGEYRMDKDAHRYIRKYELAVRAGKVRPPRPNPRRRR